MTVVTLDICDIYDEGDCPRRVVFIVANVKILPIASVANFQFHPLQSPFNWKLVMATLPHWQH